MTDPTAGQSDSVQALVVQVGERSYAFETGRTDRVITVPQLTPVPHAAGSVAGAGRVRGEIVVFLDAGRLVGADSTDSDTAVLLDRQTGGTNVAVLVDAVDGMDPVHVDEVVPPRAGELDPTVFAAAVDREDGPVGLFGPERLVAVASDHQSV